MNPADQPLSPSFFKDLVFSQAAQPMADDGAAGALILAAALLVAGVAFTQLATTVRERLRSKK